MVSAPPSTSSVTNVHIYYSRQLACLSGASQHAVRGCLQGIHKSRGLPFRLPTFLKPRNSVHLRTFSAGTAGATVTFYQPADAYYDTVGHPGANDLSVTQPQPQGRQHQRQQNETEQYEKEKEANGYK
eukprot:221289-Chlamydomonas_euryale.AAC.8